MLFYSAVLIDTWWNVNPLTIEKRLMMEKVLIDTWWNVNQGFGAERILLVVVLIDTWWNVNDFDIFRYANLFAF